MHPESMSSTPCRVRSGADRLALVTATNSGSPVPERDDAAQPDSATSSSTQASTEKPATTEAAQPKVAIGKPALGTPIDRIPVHKVSPVIEAHTRRRLSSENPFDPSDGVPRGPRRSQRLGCAHRPERHRAPRTDAPTTPLGFDWWTASVVLDTEGLWTYRVEGWSDPWETWVHNAEIKIPAGIDVELVCAEGRALFAKSAADAEAAGDTRNAALLRGAANSLNPGSGGGPVGGRACRRVRAAMVVTVPGAGLPTLTTRSSSIVGQLCSARGMSSFRAHRVRNGMKRTRSGSPARSTHRTSGWRLQPRWASMLSTSRQSIRSGPPSGDQTTRSPLVRLIHAWAIGAEGGDHHPSGPRRLRRLRSVRRQGKVAGA